MAACLAVVPYLPSIAYMMLNRVCCFVFVLPLRCCLVLPYERYAWLVRLALLFFFVVGIALLIVKGLKLCNPLAMYLFLICKGLGAQTTEQPSI